MGKLVERFATAVKSTLILLKRLESMCGWARGIRLFKVNPNIFIQVINRVVDFTDDGEYFLSQRIRWVGLF